MKIQSFGCSFLSGDELDDPAQTWPAIIAEQLGAEHENYSWPGVGNLYILNQILNHAESDSVAIINWTFIDRFDFCSFKNERWETLRPNLDHGHAEFYFDNLYGQYRDMLTALTYVKTSIDFLNHQHIPFVMTYMDDLLFEKINPNWHDAQGVEYLQNCVRPYLKNFENKSFLNWCREKKFPISKRFHPLEHAHQQAADYWHSTIQALVKNTASLS